MKLYTNAAVNHSLYMVDNVGTAIPIPDVPYKCQIRKTPQATAVFTFTAAGGGSDGTISRVVGEPEPDVHADYFLLEAAQSLVATLVEGAYHADILRVSDEFRITGFPVEIIYGETQV